ncbi:MAG: hypothetical protein QXY05_01990 [Candidatus Anstonellales archaeon]
MAKVYHYVDMESEAELFFIVTDDGGSVPLWGGLYDSKTQERLLKRHEKEKQLWFETATRVYELDIRKDFRNWQDMSTTRLKNREGTIGIVYKPGMIIGKKEEEQGPKVEETTGVVPTPIMPTPIMGGITTEEGKKDKERPGKKAAGGGRETEKVKGKTYYYFDPSGQVTVYYDGTRALEPNVRTDFRIRITEAGKKAEFKYTGMHGTWFEFEGQYLLEKKATFVAEFDPKAGSFRWYLFDKKEGKIIKEISPPGYVTIEKLTRVGEEAGLMPTGKKYAYSHDGQQTWQKQAAQKVTH